MIHHELCYSLQTPCVNLGKLVPQFFLCMVEITALSYLTGDCEDEYISLLGKVLVLSQLVLSNL